MKSITNTSLPNSQNTSMYDVSQYTDEELYQLMDLNSPTDRELEAKIYSLISKYENIENKLGIIMKNFFIDVFNHFFENENDGDESNDNGDGYETNVNDDGDETNVNGDGDETNDNDAYENNVEGFDTSNKDKSQANKDNFQENAYKSLLSEYKNELKYTKELEYTKGNLNPILKETIKRIISIDSQFRNYITYPYSTYYTFNLSETLHDVVSLKLNSFQVPYNWYTISKTYGSNFLYIKGQTNGINNSNFFYKISVDYGNYQATDLINALKNSLNNIIQNVTDTNFGTTDIIYNSINCRTTFILDINNIYNETKYYIEFPNVLPYYNPNLYISTNDITMSTHYYSIPLLFGYNDIIYTPFTVFSSPFNLQVSSSNPITPDKTTQYLIDNSNNTFTIYLYEPTINKNDTTISLSQKTTTISSFSIDTIPAEKIYSTIIIKLSLLGQQTAYDIYTDLNTQLFNNTQLINTIDQSSNISIVSDNSDKYKYKLNIRLNRKTNTNKINLKSVIVFPDITNDTIWTGNGSCFKFINKINELQNIIGENSITNTTYFINSSPYIYFKCITKGYDISVNDFNISIPNSPLNGYNLNQYFTSINTSLQNQSLIYNINNDNTSHNVEFNVNIHKIISSNNFKINTSGSFLQTILNFPETINGSLNSINSDPFNEFFLYNISSTINTFYIECIDTNPSSNLPNYAMSPIEVSITTGLYNIKQLINEINKTFITYNKNNINLSNTSITYSIQNGTTITCTLFIGIQAILTTKDYILEFNEVTPSSENTTWNSYFKFNPSYDLSLPEITNSLTQDAKIIGVSIIDYDFYLDNNNNYFYIKPLYDPVGGVYTNNSVDSFIKVTFGPQIPLNNAIQTTREQIRDYINTAFTKLSLTYGSYIDTNFTNCILRLNVNKVYTAKDYSIVFFDKESFTKCNFGPKSSITVTTYDTTIGWILGFRTDTVYYMNETQLSYNFASDNYYYGTYITNDYSYNTVTNIAKITGDTSVNVNLYNYLLIVLDDYTQNHLNDGLVTTIINDLDISLPSYTSLSNYKYDASYGCLLSNTSRNPTFNNQLTSNQIYAANQLLNNKNTKFLQNNTSKGLYTQDIFGMVPLKLSGLQNGQSFIEYSGSLQLQERIYFGPVNIKRMTVQLITDKGTVLDLNGQNWSFSLVAEQLYNKTK
jgi:hypothetical protein